MRQPSIVCTFALLTLALPSFAQTPAPAPVPAGSYTLDKSHASLIFKINHLGFSNYTARFKRFDAQLDFDPANLAASKLTATVDAKSLETDFPDPAKLDFNAQLQGKEWLDTARFPQMKFRSTHIEVTGKNTMQVNGELTLRGITHPVMLNATYNGGYAGHPMDPHARIGFSAHGALKRSDFGMGFGVPQPGTTMGVGDVVQFAIDSATGQLGAATSFATGGSPNDFWMAIDGDSRFAYLPHLDGSVDVLAIDATSGALSGPVQSVVLPVGLQAFNVALEPSGRFAYVAALALNPAPSRLIAYAIDPRAGTLTQIASADTGIAGRGLGIDPTGRFVYVANVNAANVSAFAIDARTGVPTPLAGSPFATGGSGPTSISVDRTGRRVYTANQISSTVSVFDIDPVTGALSSPVQFPSGGISPQYVALTK